MLKFIFIPELTKDIFGETKLIKISDDAVGLPWWPTFSTSESKTFLKLFDRKYSAGYSQSPTNKNDVFP